MKTTKVLPSAEHSQPTQSRAEIEAAVVEHQGMLFNRALRYTKNPDDARDLMQDTIEKALVGSDKYRPGTKIKGWLLTIMHNLFVSQWHKKVRALKLESLQETASAPSYQIYDLVWYDLGWEESLNQELADAMAAMPAYFKETFVLNVVEGETCEDIAKRLKCSIGTITGRLYRGRKFLRQHLANTSIVSP